MGPRFLRGDVHGRQGQPSHHQRERVLLWWHGRQGRKEDLQTEGKEGSLAVAGKHDIDSGVHSSFLPCLSSCSEKLLLNSTCCWPPTSWWPSTKRRWSLLTGPVWWWMKLTALRTTSPRYSSYCIWVHINALHLSLVAKLCNGNTLVPQYLTTFIGRLMYFIMRVID